MRRGRFDLPPSMAPYLRTPARRLGFDEIWAHANSMLPRHHKKLFHYVVTHSPGDLYPLAPPRDSYDAMPASFPWSGCRLWRTIPSEFPEIALHVQIVLYSPPMAFSEGAPPWSYWRRQLHVYTSLYFL